MDASETDSGVGDKLDAKGDYPERIVVPTRTLGLIEAIVYGRRLVFFTVL